MKNRTDSWNWDYRKKIKFQFFYQIVICWLFLHSRMVKLFDWQNCFDFSVFSLNVSINMKRFIHEVDTSYCSKLLFSYCVVSGEQWTRENRHTYHDIILCVLICAFYLSPSQLFYFQHRFPFHCFPVLRDEFIRNRRSCFKVFCIR